MRNSRKRRRSLRRRSYRKRNGQRLSVREYKLRRQREIILHTITFVIVLFFILSGFVFGIGKIHKTKEKKQDAEASAEADNTPLDVVDTVIKDVQLNPYLEKSADAASFFKGYKVQYVESNVSTINTENMMSTYAVLLDLDTGEVIAGKSARTRINPASMTKILTLLVAAEHIKSLDDEYEINEGITKYVLENDCMNVGLQVGDKQTVRDLMYGTILKSGADAAIGLAEYVAGSQDAFVELMNQKLEELGLSDSAHFTNCVGIFNEDHYCTPLDIAIILKAAEENALCHEILQARTYTTSPTKAAPKGINISNLFLRRIEDKDTHGEVLGAKTGYVHQAGSCGASYEISNNGKHYICVTANSFSSWRCIYDHVEIYDSFVN
ncbi:D-alanyl-D-alanine carboxypeptidase family protein [Butyrivibrio sp. LB2008]|uniref:D-alanyl-D-alanine carboxypeptidase family protein n=1 Tax=Butyrivibrio sp. LB2008 TaxID=1408305 RepID=UPI0006882812|nr:D-alanyl-D-alanine carboxypeptidase [Butyrivibrio sp. LB2008]